MRRSRRRVLQRALQGVAALLSGASAAAAPGVPPPRAVRKVLRLALPAEDSGFDPPQTNSSLYSATIIGQILEPPLAYDYLARPARLQPLTAAALPEISADGRVFTVRLRPGIYFADDPAFGGRPRELVAQDYVYAVKRFYDPQYASADLYQYESLMLPGLSEVRARALKDRTAFDYDADVDGVRALDRYTLRFTLGVANPRFVYQLADPVTCGAVAREVVEAYGGDIVAHPVGTGPFRLKSWRRGSRIVLERSPSHRGTTYDGVPGDEPQLREIATSLRGRTLPLVDEVQVDIVQEDQPRWLSFLRGDYAWLALPGTFAPIAAPAGRLAPFLAKKGIRLQRTLLADMSMSFFYMDDPLVGGYAPERVALRRAIGLAFDNPAYLRRVLGGLAVPAQSTIAPNTSGYDSGYKSEMSDHDPARAQALLDLYGYVDRDGDGWREQPDGRPLVLRMASMSSQRDRLANELWKRSMDAVGLRMEFDVSTWPELLRKSRAGTLMMWGYGWSAGSPDGGFFLAIAYGPNASESNDPRFRLEAFDRLFERQRALPDGAEREALMRQAKDMLVAYMPYKVHAHRIGADLVQPWTRHYRRHPFTSAIWRYVDLDASAR